MMLAIASVLIQCAQLLDVDRSVVTKHLKNIFENKELLMMEKRISTNIILCLQLMQLGIGRILPGQRSSASERRFYQKINDIYAMAVDYSMDSQITSVLCHSPCAKSRARISICLVGLTRRCHRSASFSRLAD